MILQFYFNNLKNEKRLEHKITNTFIRGLFTDVLRSFNLRASNGEMINEW
jgi:hypothetical protein